MRKTYDTPNVVAAELGREEGRHEAKAAAVEAGQNPDERDEHPHLLLLNQRREDTHNDGLQEKRENVSGSASKNT